MSKIELKDNIMSAMIKMSEGNPGAARAMMEICTKGSAIDPQGAMGGFGAIMLLDTWEIYGSSIYVLFNDKCKGDVRRMMLLIRAAQLGHISHTRLQDMARDQMYKINLTEEEWAEIDKKVCDYLEDFAKS